MKNKTPKRKIAAKMLTRQEKSRSFKTTVFDSFAWEDRRRKRAEKQARQGKKKVKKPSTWVSKRSLKKKNVRQTKS